MSDLLEFDDVGDGGGEAAPVGGFEIELTAAEASEGIKFGAAIIFAGAPFGFDPAFLLEFVERGIEGAVADLQDFAGDLLEAEADGEAVEGFEGEDFQEQEIESTLDEIGRFGHFAEAPLVTEGSVARVPSVSKGKVAAGMEWGAATARDSVDGAQ
jgi:hypothetical protein